ncbi:2-iminobutanoate/2-iminopropanoate deaminase [Neolewinella xylanilytica]|uniref:2-iminobutanoate/2-iminopropanoate deaminase n=1 Tax=Neolewinella xylanilytica TaxID=1514080 RepID=A0A2S6IB13_9BACT|nr:Rid family detoxifying hydrolase [Neolewinella xylanilytica]PPK88701.1 2-iminobutanoate/2-iminopropanoate deaminase [Neolewinella xylanilytica]
MEKTRITHPRRKEDFVTGAYSDGVIVGNMLFVSGQTPVDFATSSVVLGTIEEETRRVLNNIKDILEAGGASLDNVVKCTVHLADSDDFDRFNAEYATFFGGVRPARTTVASGLKHGIKVEIDVIAILD